MRKLPWLRSGASAIVFPAVFAAVFGLCFTPFLAYGAMALYYLALPLICMALFMAGRLPAYLCLGLACASFYVLIGPEGMGAGCVYLLPAVLTMHVLIAKNTSFPRSAVWMAGVIALSQLVIYVFVQVQYNRDAYRVLAAAAAEAIRAEGEVGDVLLMLLNTSGILPISQSLEGSAALNGLGGLTDAVREDLLSTLQSELVSYLTVFVPSMISGMSIYEGVLAVYAAARSDESVQNKSVRMTEIRSKDIVLPVPAMRRWYLKRGWGLKIGVLAVGFILVRVNNDTLQLLGRVFMEVFTAVFTLQGMALVNDMQARRGRKKWVRVLVPCLLLAIMPSVMWILGCADQVMDIRKLRPPEGTEGNEEL